MPNNECGKIYRIGVFFEGVYFADFVQFANFEISKLESGWGRLECSLV